MMNRNRFDAEGTTISLINSLITSAKGCPSPSGPTRFGPTRDCMPPMTLRSKYVENATVRITPIVTITILNMTVVRY